jgi:hypothetical protein
MKRVYLDPMSPDGKPGEVREVEVPDAGVRSIMAPVSYAEHAVVSRAALEKERDALLASLSGLSGGARAKADHQIRVLEREIRLAIDMEESAKRKTERDAERKAQSPGINTPVTHFSGTMCQLKALVRDAGAAVATLVAAVKPKPVRSLKEWITTVFDPQQKQRALDMIASGDPQQKARALEHLGRSGLPLAETSKAPAAVHAQNSAEDSIYRPV